MEWCEFRFLFRKREQLKDAWKATSKSEREETMFCEEILHRRRIVFRFPSRRNHSKLGLCSSLVVVFHTDNPTSITFVLSMRSHTPTSVSLLEYKVIKNQAFDILSYSLLRFFFVSAAIGNCWHCYCAQQYRISHFFVRQFLLYNFDNSASCIS